MRSVRGVDPQRLHRGEPVRAEPADARPGGLGPACASWVTRYDVLVAGVTLVLGASTAAFTATKHGEPRFTPAAFAVLAFGALALITRRRFPASTLIVVGVTAAVYGAFDWPDPLLPFAVFVALSTVFERCPPATKWTAWAASAASAMLGTALIKDSDALDWWTAVFMVTAAPLAGDYLRARRRLLEEANARIERLEAERLHALDDARAAERARVARELHDVVAHHVTMLVVQAEAAASQPALAGTATQSSFDDLARSGRAAMTELRRMLGVLRSNGDAPLTAPQPTLRALDALVADVTSSGIAVTVQRAGSLDALPIAVDLTAYRIVQEGLTNVVKHAPGASAVVAITPAANDLTVTVTNTQGARRTGPEAPTGRGVGLIGLSERVELLGGTLAAGPQPLGGYRLQARLPMETP